jgi:8-oxo-dGTP diphosphatase
MAKKIVRVGVAIIWNGDRSKILIDKRLPKGEFGGFWEFPGGKLEGNEDAIACIHREIREELGIEIAVYEHLITVEQKYGEHFSLNLIVHQAKHISGEPQALECAEIKWVKISELNQYSLPPANCEIVEALLKAS